MHVVEEKFDDHFLADLAPLGPISPLSFHHGLRRRIASSASVTHMQERRNTCAAT